MTSAPKESIMREEGHLSEATNEGRTGHTPTDADWADFGKWCERDKLDAARYRWLRGAAHRQAYSNDDPFQRLQFSSGWTIYPIPDDTMEKACSFDAAVDAAMAAECRACAGSGTQTAFDSSSGPDGNDFEIDCDKCGGTGVLPTADLGEILSELIAAHDAMETPPTRGWPIDEFRALDARLTTAWGNARSAIAKATGAAA
jgi:hypothetical protein